MQKAVGLPSQLRFQFSPPHRGHQHRQHIYERPLPFQFSPPHRGHQDAGRVLVSDCSFNSRPRTGGIVLPAFSTLPAYLFQFSPPHRGHHVLIRTASRAGRFQFSPPHRGHHTLPSPLVLEVSRFNSRPRTGGIWHHHHQRNQPDVSILAPAQGASRPVCHAACRLLCFNSRPRTGGINAFGVGSMTSAMFQFSPPHRGHHVLKSQYSISLPVFQFSPPHRGHPCSRISPVITHPFQFSPPHRGHPQLDGKIQAGLGFQFSPPHRGHLSGLFFCDSWQNTFQFSPPHRGHHSAESRFHHFA